MINYKIRRLQSGDFEHGFFETLANLTVVGEVDLEKARKIYEEIHRIEICRNPVYNIFVAVNDIGEIIGTTSLIVEQKFTRSLSKAGRVEDVVVRPEWQAKGIGTALNNALEYEGERQGCYKVMPTTRSPKNVEWYINRGYSLHGFELRKDLPLD